ncbi:MULTISPECIES: Mini-ribonuclease 3 [Staphylococcus]|uniref:Mini-ribonuclease 3 n=1 Tax=Staphylococcus lugdunensis TaxID=28035 RepID=A0ABX6BY28_STALU|nr:MULTISPECIES: Mini-ribonuclease 3 [Staphylococcus]ADC88445.1 putative cysteinyl-tRNA synthetase [Staphylococcus lugdunensis HKU09-01]ARJ10197.1 ribonuclease III [Staphylococcus lugdunensis]ARJ17419.1 ribonuclease III [Staphylococcus lugdunensis]ARJ30884.1 ribonuclease III [Staphylococcus lugdunensis]MCH8640969.1 Mini-ribonuclease 3 [Staphylococcus lugdunensis]
MDIKLLNPLTLAYMGDAVLDQHVRAYIVLKLRSKPNRLHQAAKRYVSAKSQAQTLEKLLAQQWFTEEELDIVRRGRNAKSYTKAKNTDIQTYRKSSAIEAVIGFLYLEQREQRLNSLLTEIIHIVDEREVR